MASSRKSRSSDLTALVGRALDRYVPRGSRLTLALSGGLDSIVLLDVLAAIAPTRSLAIDCLHVNHALSPNAAAWARFARAAARGYGLPCTVRHADLAPYRALGREGAARAARYALFARAEADLLVLAQHADDQAETVLLQLVRGAGLAGLAAMPAVRPQRSARAPRLLRPMLGVGRAEIEVYARVRALRWVEDESNRDTRLARNFVRHRVMPLLRELNPVAGANLARSATLLAEANELAQALGAVDTAAATDGGYIEVAALGSLSPARAKNALRWAIAQAGLGIPDSTRLEALLAQLVGARADASMRIAVDGGEVRRFRGTVRFLPQRAPLPPHFRATWPGRMRWRLPELGGEVMFKRSIGQGLAAAALAAGTIEIRTRRGGERFQPDSRRPRRELKSLLQESGIPPWERERLPLLFCDGQLAWVPGLGIDAGQQALAGERGVEPSWVPLPTSKRQRSAKPVIK